MFRWRWSSGPQNQSSKQTDDTGSIEGVSLISLRVGALINFTGHYTAVMGASALNSDAVTWPAVCTRSIGGHKAIGNCDAATARSDGYEKRNHGTTTPKGALDLCLLLHGSTRPLS
jgi:hypothetical protein